MAESQALKGKTAPVRPRERGAGQGRFFGLLAMLVGVSFLSSLANNSLSTMLVKLAEDFDTSVAVVGRLGAFLFFAWAGVAVFVGPLSDVVGRRPLFIVGLGLMALGALGAGFAWDFVSLAVFCVAIGAGGATAGPSVGASIGDLLPPRWHGRAFGLLNAAGSSASLVGLPILSLIIAGLGWRWAFWTMALGLGMLVALFVLRFPKTQPQKHHGFEVGRHIAHVVRRPRLWQVHAIGFLASGGWYLFFLYFPASLVRRFGVAEGGVALPIALVSLGMVLGAYLGGEAAQRRNRLLLGVASFGITAVLAVAMVFVKSAPVYLTLGFLFVLFQGLPFPSILATLNGMAGRHRATVLGFFTFACQMGGFVGSIAGSTVIAAVGYAELGFVSMVAVVLAAVILYLLPRRRALHIFHRRPSASG